MQAKAADCPVSDLELYINFPRGTVSERRRRLRGVGGETTRLEAHDDYEINRKAEEEVRAVLDHLSAQDEALTKIVETLAARANGAA